MWSSKEVSLMVQILDQLIPPNSDKAIPGAGELGVWEFIQQSARNDVAFNDQVTALLNLVQGLSDGISPHLVRQLENELPQSFQALVIETYKGYYSRPDIRTKLGIGEHPVHPRGYDVSPETPEMLDRLTAPVTARGAIYRDPTGQMK